MESPYSKYIENNQICIKDVLETQKNLFDQPLTLELAEPKPEMRQVVTRKATSSYKSIK